MPVWAPARLVRSVRAVRRPGRGHPADLMGSWAVADARAMTRSTQQEVAALRRTVVRSTLMILALALIVLVAALAVPAINKSNAQENARTECALDIGACP